MAEQLIPLSPEDVAALRAAKQQSADEATRTSGMLTRNVAVPLAQAGIAAATGGMSIPAQMLIGGGTELAAQAAGLAPESKWQVAAAALAPGAAKLIQRGARVGGQMLGRISHTPEQIGEVGEEAMAKALGAEPDLIKRSAQTPASDALYAAARNQPDVNTRQLQQYIDNALIEQRGMSTPDPRTVNRLQNLSDKLRNNPTLPAKEVVDELQTLGHASSQAFKQDLTVSGKALSGATKGAKAQAGLTTQADKAYAREQDIKDILTAGRTANPARAIDEVIASKGTTMSLGEDELRQIKDIAHRIGSASLSHGSMVGSLIERSQESLGQMLANKTGRAMLRTVLGPEGKVSPAAISTALQFWRAYQAQNGGK